MVSCKYDPNHKISPDHIENHEEKCLLRINEYSQEDQFLPQPFNSDAGTLMKLGKPLIQHCLHACHNAWKFTVG